MNWKLWRSALLCACKRLVCFVDNEGARYLILKGYSGNSNRTYANLVALVEERSCIFAWYPRVPSEGNLSDFPSRLTKRELLRPETESQVGFLKGAIEDVCSRQEAIRSDLREEWGK